MREGFTVIAADISIGSKADSEPEFTCIMLRDGIDWMTAESVLCSVMLILLLTRTMHTSATYTSRAILGESSGHIRGKHGQNETFIPVIPWFGRIAGLQEFKRVYSAGKGVHGNEG